MVTQKKISPRVQLSDSVLARMAFAKRGRKVVHDSQLVGYQVVVGVRSKVFRVRLKGSYRTLGHWPVLPADEARALALDALREHAAVRRQSAVSVIHSSRPAPSGEQGGAAADPILSDVLTAYVKTRTLKTRTASDYWEILNRYAADWLSKPITAITSDVFEERFRKVSIKSKAQANYLARVLSAQWTFGAAKYGYCEKNPTERLKVLGGFHKIKPRDGIIPDSLQGKWWQSVESLGDRQVSAAFIFMMLTGCRKGEALGIQVTDIDWQSRTVTFAETKNGNSHRLPLGRRLYALLKLHCKGRTNGPVFETTTRIIQAATVKLSSAVGLKWTAHDLRRTFITAAQRTLNDLATVKRLVNHSLGGDVTTKHYLRLSVEDLRKPMQTVEDAISRLRDGGQKQSRH